MTPSMRRRRLVLLGGGLAAVLAGAGGWYHHRARAGLAPLVDVLPAFVEPGPGPRAASSRALGVELGATSLLEVRAQLVRSGFDCADTSMRALMQKMRADKQREIAERRARGQEIDSVSGASALRRRSPKEANPQVRLACPDVPSDELGDAPRPPARGRLLYVFDSPRHPVRHASFERTYRPEQLAQALADVNATRARLASQHGPATADPGQLHELPWLSPRELRWRFADLEVKLHALNWGVRGIVVSETVEVPWPVRADAPRRPISLSGR